MIESVSGGVVGYVYEDGCVGECDDDDVSWVCGCIKSCIIACPIKLL